MPRTARIISSTDKYHVMLRGNNRQTIFFDPQDYQKFYELLVKNKKICGYKCYAWCLMPNHIHLLIEDPNHCLGNAIMRITTGFVGWYNRKYNRVGHVFEGRYVSEPIESNGYFFRVFRYINMNPVKGGICEKPDEYPYSSYNTYFHSSRYPEGYLYFDLYTKDEFIAFHLEHNNDQFLDIDYYYQRAQIRHHDTPGTGPEGACAQRHK